MSQKFLGWSETLWRQEEAMAAALVVLQPQLSELSHFKGVIKGRKVRLSVTIESGWLTSAEVDWVVARLGLPEALGHRSLQRKGRKGWFTVLACEEEVNESIAQRFAEPFGGPAFGGDSMGAALTVRPCTPAAEAAAALGRPHPRPAGTLRPGAVVLYGMARCPR